MGRQRFIHPGIWVSEDFCALSHGARLLFIGLFSLADDEGRGKGSARALKASVFPSEDVPITTVEQWREEIANRGLARFYIVNQVVFYDLPMWGEYQKPRFPTASKYPAFQVDAALPKDYGSPTVDLPYSSSQGRVWVGIGLRERKGRAKAATPHEQGTLPTIPVAARAAPVFSPGFLRWWQAYPKKAKRARAWHEWRRLRLEPRTEELLAALARQARDRAISGKTPGVFVPAWPDPERWLKDERWEDGPISGTNQTEKPPEPEENRLLSPEERKNRAKT